MNPIEKLVDIFFKTWTLLLAFFEARKNSEVDSTINGYNDLHSQKDAKGRESNYMSMVNAYYNVSTIFYEWGWGSSFHFATQKKYENFDSSIIRHEVYLAHRLRLKEGMKVIDVGCGIGGPLRNIARATKASIHGINNNDYQIKRGTVENKKLGLDKTCGFIKGDFCKMPLSNDSIDAAYAIEATCHAPKRQLVYGEIFRVLKPGACFAAYEWCLTDNYDPKNPEHRKIKKMIETGDGLPDMVQPDAIDEALKEVGFEILETRDVIEDETPEDRPWYDPLVGRYFPPKNIIHTNLGRKVCLFLLQVLETLRLAPKGSQKVSQMLYEGSQGLESGGKLKIFTPAYYFLVQKPYK